MSIGDILLLTAMIVTVGHMIADVALTVRHAVHPMDTWLTVGSVTMLIAHIVFTGEARQWASLLAGR